MKSDQEQYFGSQFAFSHFPTQESPILEEEHFGGTRDEKIRTLRFEIHIDQPSHRRTPSSFDGKRGTVVGMLSGNL